MTKTKTPISVVLVIYNEETVLARCLDSCKNIADEIIIVHDWECHDTSLEIASSYTDKIHIRQHCWEAEAHRSFTFSIAKNNWILQLDADEYLSEELQQWFRTWTPSDMISIYEMQRVLLEKTLQGTTQKRWWEYKRVFFNKKNIAFLWSIQEAVQPINNTKVMKCHQILRHQPNYVNFSYHTFIVKQKKRAKLHAQQLTRPITSFTNRNYTKTQWPLRERVFKIIPIFGILYRAGWCMILGVRKWLWYKDIYHVRVWLFLWLYYVRVYWFYTLLSIQNFTKKYLSRN